MSRDYDVPVHYAGLYDIIKQKLKTRKKKEEDRCTP